MNLEIKKDRELRSGAWECELWIDGVRTVAVENEGRGGADRVTWLVPRPQRAELEAALRAHAQANPITTDTPMGPLIADGTGEEWDGTYIMALAEQAKTARKARRRSTR